MKKIKQFFSDFKKFISRGNVVDMAVGVIVASAFTAIVTALTNKIIMPCINWLLSLGGAGLESAYTFLKVVKDANGVIDLTKSIYIDWGAFITAILNFFIIAFVLFTVLRIMMDAQGLWKKSVKERPTREEKKILKKQGVNMKDYHAVIKATAELREKNKPAPVAPKPTQEELLTQILEDSMARVGDTKDRMESAGIEFFNRVRNGYLEIAKQEPTEVIEEKETEETAKVE